MTAAFFATLAVAVVLIAVLLVRERSRRGALEQARREVSAAGEQAEEADRLRREAEASIDAQAAATASLSAEREAAAAERVASAEARVAEIRETSRGRIDALERNLREAEAERRRLRDDAAAQTAGSVAAAERIASLEAAADASASQVTALEAELAGLRARPSGVAAPEAAGEPAAADDRPVDQARGGWLLLLARIERQWADAVNAGPDERGVVDATPGEQLAQAVQRDLERLREEVGVEATMAPGDPVHDDDPITTLLAIGEAVALLASRSEQVQVALRDPVVVSGHDWTGDEGARHRLEQLASVASLAAMHGTVEINDDLARVVLGLPNRRT